MPRHALLPLLLAALLPACAWVKLEPAGREVRVARSEAVLSDCTKAGTITVSVRDRVAFYERNHIKVREELETLARNEAAAMPADALVALADPANGEQRFSAWRCGANATARTTSTPRTTDAATSSRGFEPVETYPVDDGDQR